MSRDVPSGWRSVFLADIAEIVGGSTPSKANHSFWENGSVAWATPSDVTALPEGVLGITDTNHRVTHAALEQTSLRVLPPGSVMMTSRATIGYPAINEVPMATNQGFACFLPNGQYDSTFLAQWIIFKRDALKSIAGGSTFPEISKKTLRSVPILLPPLPEQRRIAEILSSVDEAIQATEAVIEQTRKVKDGVLERLLTKGIGHTEFKETEVGMIPASWTVAKLAETGRWFSGGTPSKGDPAYWDYGNIPWVSPKDMKRPYIDDAELQVTELGARNGTRVMGPDALLVVVRGMILARYVPVATNSKVITFNQDIKALRCNDDYSSVFLRMYLELKNERLMRKIDSATHGTKRLPQEALLDFDIPSPPRKEQDHIVKEIQGFERVIEQNRILLGHWSALKSSLMSDLLTGRKRVTDAMALAAE